MNNNTALSEGLAEFAYNQDNPKYNGKGEPPSMVYEMAEKAWKLWHLKDFTLSIQQETEQRVRREEIEKLSDMLKGCPFSIGEKLIERINYHQSLLDKEE